MSPNNFNDSPDGTIPVDEAIQLALNWRTFLDSSAQGFVAESFLIPIIAFQNILLYNPEADGVRAYIGLSDPTDPTTAQLLLVPVSEGQDVIYLPIGTIGYGAGDSSNVYDYTKVCPPICPPPGSPLTR
jgi:hypothetical protein